MGEAHFYRSSVSQTKMENLVSCGAILESPLLAVTFQKRLSLAGTLGLSSQSTKRAGKPPCCHFHILWCFPSEPLFPFNTAFG